MSLIFAPRLRAPRAATSSRRRDRWWLALTYLAPSVFISVITFTWFQPGRFIGAGDVSPMLRTSLEAEAGSFWSHQITGAGSTTPEAGRVLEVFLIQALRPLGLSELAVQRVLFILVLSFACFGVTHLARLVVRNPFVASIAGLLAVFNPFVLLHLPILLYPMTIGVIGLLLGELLGYLDDRPTSVIRLVFSSLPLAYLSINPPLLLVAGVVTTGVFLVALRFAPGGAASARTVRNAIPLTLGVHIFWVLPFLLLNLGGPDGLSFAAVTSAESWGWVSAQSSVDRVVTLTAHWGWPHAEYFPWTATLDSAPWVVLRWVLPVGALLGAIFAPPVRRKLAYSLLFTAALLAMFSQGLHAPFGAINGVLYDHVPGWWLLRDPVSKLGPLLVIVYALLFALFVDRVVTEATEGRLRDSKRPVRIAVSAFAAFAVVAAVVHPYPLLTGDAVPEERGALPSTHVAVPPAWSDIGAAVSASPVAGKVAVLPLNEFYQVTTSWGYHGVDVVPQIFDRPVLQRFPGGYFAEVAGYETLLESMQAAVLAGDSVAANRLLDVLGASHLVIRRDVEPGLSGRLLATSEDLLDGSLAVGGLDPLLDTDVAVVYERPGAQQIRVEQGTVAAGSGTESTAVLSNIGAVVSPDRRADRVVWNDSSDPTVTFRSNDDNYALTLASTNHIDVELTLDDTTLRADLTDQVTVDGELVDMSPVLAIETDNRPVDALLSNGTVTPYTEGMDLSLAPGQVVTALSTENERNLWLPGLLSNCENSAGRTNDELGLNVRGLVDGIVLSAEADSACVVFDLGRNLGVGELRLTMQSESGKPARLCVWSNSAGRCVVSDQVNGGEAVERSYLIDAEDRVEGLELFVYADGGADETTVTSYRDITIRTLQALGSTAFVTNDRVAALDLGPGEHELAIVGRERSILGSFGELGDCGRSDDRTMAEAGLEAMVGEPTASGVDVELAAIAHAACVRAPVQASHGETVVVSFAYDAAPDVTPRFCFWQSGVDSCAFAPLVDGTGRYRAEVTFDPAATGFDLYLYADGDDADGTRIHYRDVLVTPALGLGLALEPADSIANTAVNVGGVPGVESGPVVHAEATSASSYSIELDDVTGEFVLVVPESFAEGWKIDGLPSDWVAEHLMVDGYANGWRIQGEGSATLTVSYGPGELVRIANDVSPAALLAFFLYAAFTRRRDLLTLKRSVR